MVVAMLIAGAPGFPAGSAWQVFVPGLLVQLSLFGSAFVGFNILSDLRSGVLERMRVTPVSRTALLLGRVLRDAVVLLVQSVVLLVLAEVVFGLRAPLLGEISLANPLRYIVDAIRDAFLGRYGTATLAHGVLAAALLAAVGGGLGVRAFRTENR